MKGKERDKGKDSRGKNKKIQQKINKDNREGKEK